MTGVGGTFMAHARSKLGNRRPTWSAQTETRNSSAGKLVGRRLDPFFRLPSSSFTVHEANKKVKLFKATDSNFELLQGPSKSFAAREDLSDTAQHCAFFASELVLC